MSAGVDDLKDAGGGWSSRGHLISREPPCRRRLTQVKAEEMLGVDPTKVSVLARGRLTRFS